MDLWAVAAAAGVGYAAKANYMKNSTSRVTEGSIKTFSFSCEIHGHSHHRNLLQQIRDKTCPLCRLETASSGSNEFVDLSQFISKESNQLKKRANNWNVLKPLDFSETWLAAAELYYGEEENLYTSTPSSAAFLERALTIGSLIARRSFDFRKEMELVETRTGPFNSQGPSNNDLHVFFVGIAIGMMLIITYNRREEENLIELLKKNENLVLDLYEELEMKDHLTLKELDNDGVNERSVCETRTAFSTEQGKGLYDEKKEKNPEAMSKIEAELEAELERLQLTMESSGLGRNYDFVQDESSSGSGHEVSGSSSDYMRTGIYSVSPQELSLRLHEVIQSRLRATIVEIEAELEKSLKRLQDLESDI